MTNEELTDFISDVIQEGEMRDMTTSDAINLAMNLLSIAVSADRVAGLAMYHKARRHFEYRWLAELPSYVMHPRTQ